VLGADARAEQRVLGGGDVTDGEDVGVAGAQGRVDKHAAVAEREAGLFRESRVGGRAYRDKDGVSVDGGPVAELQPGRFAACGSDLLHGCSQPKVDTVFAVQGGEHLADFATERGHQRKLGHLDDRDVDAAVSGAGGHLQADPTAADDGQRRTFGQHRIQCVGIVDGA
jgi:hypothetical protein